MCDYTIRKQLSITRCAAEKQKNFEITNEIIDHLADIAESTGRLDVTPQVTANPTLRCSNRIRTIYGPPAIEQNTLFLEQVTAVLNGKHVLPSPKVIFQRQLFLQYKKWSSHSPLTHRPYKYLQLDR